MTPAEELTAAADRLDARLAAATRGPWRADKGWHVTSGEHREGVAFAFSDGDHAYIAAMGPDVGRALAVLLRGMARWYEVNGTTIWPGGTDHFRDLARAILGTREDT